MTTAPKPRYRPAGPHARGSYRCHRTRRGNGRETPRRRRAHRPPRQPPRPAPASGPGCVHDAWRTETPEGETRADVIYPRALRGGSLGRVVRASIRLRRPRADEWKRAPRRAASSVRRGSVRHQRADDDGSRQCEIRASTRCHPNSALAGPAVCEHNILLARCSSRRPRAARLRGCIHVVERKPSARSRHVPRGDADSPPPPRRGPRPDPSRLPSRVISSRARRGTLAFTSTDAVSSFLIRWRRRRPRGWFLGKYSRALATSLTSTPRSRHSTMSSWVLARVLRMPTRVVSRAFLSRRFGSPALAGFQSPIHQRIPRVAVARSSAWTGRRRRSRARRRTRGTSRGTYRHCDRCQPWRDR